MVSRTILHVGTDQVDDGFKNTDLASYHPKRKIEVVVNEGAAGPTCEPIEHEDSIVGHTEAESLVTVKVDGKVVCTLYVRNTELSDHEPNALGFEVWTTPYDGACTKTQEGSYRV